MFAGQDTDGDKTLLDLHGKTLLARVIATLAPQVTRIIINANGDPARFAAFGLPVVPDAVGDFSGPLAGILAGMRWAAAIPRSSPSRPTPLMRVLSVSTDAPFLPDDLAARLLAAARDKPGAIALAASQGKVHPVMGLWPVALADDLAAALRRGERTVLAWAERHDTVRVDFPPRIIDGTAIDPFFNINTPADLAMARRLYAHITSCNSS